MKAEKIILSIVAVFVGLIAAGIAFYLYQMTKTLPPSKTQTLAIKTSSAPPTPTPNNSYFISIDTPKDEEVFDTKTISISGKTVKDSTVVVSSESTDQVVKPASNGNFSLTMPIDDGTTLLHITAIYPNGEEKSVTKTVTYSTETF